MSHATRDDQKHSGAIKNQDLSTPKPSPSPSSSVLPSPSRPWFERRNDFDHRDLTPTPPQTPDSFDFEACLERIRYWVQPTHKYTRGKLPEPSSCPSVEEASFWLLTLSLIGEAQSTNSKGHALWDQTLLETIPEKILSLHPVQPDFDQVARWVEALESVQYETYAPCVMALLDWDVVAQLEQAECIGRSGFPLHLFYEKHRLPRLSSPERETLIQRLSEVLWRPFSLDLQPLRHHFPYGLYVASLLGRHDLLLDFLHQLPAHAFQNQTRDTLEPFHQIQTLLFTLPKAEMIREFRRLGVPLLTEPHVNEWLRITAWEALDEVRQCILEPRNHQPYLSIYSGILEVHAPEIAPLALESHRLKQTVEGQRWLEHNVDHAHWGLIPIAMDPQHPLWKTARTWLKIKATHTSHTFRDALKQKLSPEEDQFYQNHILFSFPPSSKSSPPVISGWIYPDLIPEIPRVFSSQHDFERWIEALQQTPPGSYPDLLDTRFDLRIKTDEQDLIRPLVLELYEQWQCAGSPNESLWICHALGFFGDTNGLEILMERWATWQVHRLFPKIEAAISGISLSRHPKAIAFIQALWNEELSPKKSEKIRHLMQNQEKLCPHVHEAFLDQQIQNFGLNFLEQPFLEIQGQALFSRLDAQSLKVRLTTLEGKPQPESLDLLLQQTTLDRYEKRSLKHRWKQHQREVQETLQRESARLYRAMLDQRRWLIETWVSWLEHPLMRPLIAPLILGLYDENDQLTYSFRFDEDDQPVDRDETPFSLPTSGHRIGILEPLDIPLEARAAWVELLANYQLAPLFPQFHSIHLIPDQTLREIQCSDLTSIQHVARLNTTLMISHLQSLGWNVHPLKAEKTALRRAFLSLPKRKTTLLIELTTASTSFHELKFFPRAFNDQEQQTCSPQEKSLFLRDVPEALRIHGLHLLRPESLTPQGVCFDERLR